MTEHMSNRISIALIVAMSAITLNSNAQDAVAIMNKVDENMNSRTNVITSDMVIHGRRGDRTVTSKGYTEGTTRSYTEYLAPAREKGTKMLKLDDRLWIYSPSTDRTIQLSGHMLRQSVMGSDLSYEDMMEDRKLMDMYTAKVVGEESLEGRVCWILELIAKVPDVSYESRKIWVDKERFVPMKEDLFAKSGQLLKQTVMSDVKQFGKRWYPTKINYKDMLKDGKGTDFIATEIQFDVDIPESVFNKASLKK